MNVIVKAVAGLLTTALGILGGGVPLQGQLRDDIRDQQWHLDFLDIDQAHELSTGEGVIVGVIDSGVDAGHPDLAANLLPGADFSFEHRPDAWEDLRGHGTAMAGLIAANGRALGIAPHATILPVRDAVTDPGIVVGAAPAIDWAVDHGATVLCLAFGSEGPDQDIRSSVARAVAADVVVVAGVGNTPDHGPMYPAAYPGVVGAAGVDRFGNHAAISVIDPSAILAAPAEHIVSTAARNVEPNGYRTGTGTSDATAIIAGVAALLRSRFPDLTAPQIIDLMTSTAQDKGPPGRDDQYGFGIVNPVAALNAGPQLTNTPTTSSTANENIDDSNHTLLIIAASTAATILLITGLALALRRRT